MPAQSASHQGAGRPNPHHSICQPTNPSRYGTTDELMAMVDEHLAWQADTDERPGSSGTMFVDWDSSGEIRVSSRKKDDMLAPVPARVPSRAPFGCNVPSHARVSSHTQWPSQAQPPTRTPSTSRHDPKVYKRKPVPAAVPPPLTLGRVSEQSTSSASRNDSVHSHPHPRTTPLQKPLPRTPAHQYTTADGFSVSYHPSRPSRSTPATTYPAYISGRDAATQMQYDYDGRVVHVHRSGSVGSKASRVSDYYVVDAEAYSATTPFHVMDHGKKKEEKEEKRCNVVVRFVEKVLHKIHRLG
ncbi:hypothetical protein EJ02DRAFT_476179 [Clathrospora elynae]|uniref:Uncharacterized protein n=1 Tax=Clathrospora elynae TaxID=706981 RepID=A0A6A5SJT1_9PLEO|nr:hypothetical protein EJ02DRAFT_476179 [Clathrospora elynae]